MREFGPEVFQRSDELFTCSVRGKNPFTNSGLTAEVIWIPGDRQYGNIVMDQNTCCLQSCYTI